MSFWERVEYLREYQNMTRKELSAKASFSIASISTGISRGSVPSADVALRIAKILDVSVEYLITGKDTHKKEGPISPAARRLCDLFLILDDKDQQAVLKLVESLAERYANSGGKEKSSVPAG